MSIQCIKSGPRRSFELTVGLRPGYGPRTNTHPFPRVIGIVTGHLKACAAAKKPYLSGMIVGGEMCYAWAEPSGVIEGRNEPCAVYRGEVSPLYNAEMTDEAALTWLTGLADLLAESLNQTRIYIAYGDKLHIFQRDGREP